MGKGFSGGIGERNIIKKRKYGNRDKRAEEKGGSAYIFTEHGIIDIASVSKPEYEPFTLVNALVHAIIFADDNPAVD